MLTDAARDVELPLLVSVDDHVVEPPSLWTDRISARYAEEVPHVVRELVPSMIDPDTKKWADVWYYGSARVPIPRGFATVSYIQEDSNTLELSIADRAKNVIRIDREPMTFDEMRPGCLDVGARLSDMDLDGVEASVCFPNAFVRFCGQVFYEAPDRDLALLCVRAYNDWLVDEWSQPSQGRLMGVGIVPLWDAQLAADEVRRISARGLSSVTFSEIPVYLGLPTMYSGYWDPFFAACEETRTVINLHIGSSSRLGQTSPDAAYGLLAANFFTTQSLSLSDWLISGAFVRFPGLRIAFSEGQAGWIPYLLSRLDQLWHLGPSIAGFDRLSEPPSHYIPGHVFACVFDDPVAMDLINKVGENDIYQMGEDNICIETDYPHNDSTWPHSVNSISQLTSSLTSEQREKVLRTNGARLYNIERILRPSAP